MAGAYAAFERGVSNLEATLSFAVEKLRAAYALDPDSQDHRTAVQAKILGELLTSDTDSRFLAQKLGSMLVVAMDQLSRCSGQHVQTHDEPSVEDWE